jgi:AcrR family transcriptional regulator
MRGHPRSEPIAARKEPGRSRGRPKLEDVAAIERRLLAIALKEFTAHGYGGTSMARIVKAAGVSKTTLYSRFSSKEELFRAIMHDQIDRLAASTLLRPDAGPPNLEAGLKTYASRALEFSMRGEMLEVNRLIYSEAHRFPELGAAASEATELGIAQISGFIAQCAAADGLRCRNPRAVAEAFIFLLRGWYAAVMLTNRSVSRAVREQWVEGAVNTLVSARKDW